MLNGIKNKIENELCAYAVSLDRDYRLSKVAPPVAAAIKDFILRPGKRIRPTLFVLAYLAYADREAKGLYTSSLSIELLHDFMLIHDDIIDKASLRRGKPSMHALLAAYCKSSQEKKFSGQDLAIVVGDIVYSLAVDAFLAIKEEPLRKEKALHKFMAAALYTGCGEFMELILGVRPIEKIKQADIYAIYDLKTAYYTFAYPLSIGATLAGASDEEIEKVFRYGVYLGRAFQILDDILGMFSDESQIGKSVLSDLQEAKKTLLIWYAYTHSKPKYKKEIKGILAKKKVTRADLVSMRLVLLDSGALGYARTQIRRLTKKAFALNAALQIPSEYKKFLTGLAQALLY